jgi:DNA repair exonuclease SbcCD nuclease subunit
MKTAAIADAHARGQDLDCFDRQFRRAFDVALSLGADIIVIVGDLFDDPNIASGGKSMGDILAVVKEAIESASDLIPIHLIPGQHDKENETSRDALTAIEGMPNVFIYRQPTWAILHSPVGSSSVLAAMLPWMYQNSAGEVLKNLLETKPDLDAPSILCGHLQVRGARMNSGHPCDRGTYSISKTQLLDGKFDRYFLGDFHRRQDLTNGKGGYVGAIRQKNFSFVEDPQGFELWDSETNEVEWIEIDYCPRHEILLWHEGEPRPEPTPGVKTRIKTVGWIATDVDKMDAEKEVEFTVKTTHIESRIEISALDDLSDDPKALLNLYLDQRRPDITNRAELFELLSDLI